MADKTKKKQGLGSRIVFWLAAIVLVACLALLALFGLQYCIQSKNYDDLTEFAHIEEDKLVDLNSLTVDWASLKQRNPDIVAWIYVPGTVINYPVVQGRDNEEYLHRGFDGQTGFFASKGTIFLDATNDPDFKDRNNVLYGHHMNDGSMFAAMAGWYDTKLFNENRSVYVLTPEGNYRCETFAYVRTVASDQIVKTQFATDESYAEYVQDKLNRSLAEQQGVVLSATDVKQSFMFSTCEYTNNDGRAVVFAAVVETTVKDDPWVTASAGTSMTDVTESEAEGLKQAA